MIILFGSVKGGCGKSTTSASFCAELARMGKDVVAVDSDRQSTLSNWITYRGEHEGLPVVHSVQKYENIRATLQDLDKRYEFVVVDAAGRDSKELRTALTTADILISPFKASQSDLDTLPKLQATIDQAKDFNEKLRAFGLLTMAPTNPSVKEVEEAKDYLQDLPDLNLLNTILSDRKVYRDSQAEGLGVTEMNNPKAKAEIESLVSEVLNA